MKSLSLEPNSSKELELLELSTKQTCRWIKSGVKGLNFQKPKITLKCSFKEPSKTNFHLINPSQALQENLKRLISHIMIHNCVFVRIVSVGDIFVKCIKLSQIYPKIVLTRKISLEKILSRIKLISQLSMIDFKVLIYQLIQFIWRITLIEKEMIFRDQSLKIYWKQVDLHLT